MKSLIITVAGTATRFNKDTQNPTLKCLYEIGGYKNTLLYQILDKARDFDEFIIVGGYLFDVLESFVNQNLAEFNRKIKLIYNPCYSTFGSGYSLILGILHSNPLTDEIIFVEGDLYFDSVSFNKVKEADANVITVNHCLISADSSVVVYENVKKNLRYLYDTSHTALQISEPFLAIYNSGQIWKFRDVSQLQNVVANLSETQKRGTNLEIIQGYFGELDSSEYKIIDFKTWFNCNTVNDYKAVVKFIENDDIK